VKQAAVHYPHETRTVFGSYAQICGIKKNRKIYFHAFALICNPLILKDLFICIENGQSVETRMKTSENPCQ
jgi:hypothetical protein